MSINYGYGVELSTLKEDMLKYIRNWRNCTDVMRWCRQTDLIDEISQKNWFEKIINDNSIKMYAIGIETERHIDIVGVCGLTSITPIHNTAEFSIYICPEEQRKCYATAALKSLIRHGFDNLNLNRIWGETFDGNPGIALYEKLGFKKEGTLRQSYYKCGQYIDSHIYSILEQDYTLTNYS